MTRADAFRAFRVGLELGERWAGGEGFRVVALGEMGIGNTTTAAALIAAMTGATAAEVVGRGTGVDESTLELKRAVVASAVERHGRAGTDLWDVMAGLGGFEILGLAGLAVSSAGRGRWSCSTG